MKKILPRLLLICLALPLMGCEEMKMDTNVFNDEVEEIFQEE